MNQATFLRILEKNLDGFDESEKKEILNDFTEYFSVAIERGESEYEISKKLGNPEDIARELRLERGIEIHPVESNNKASVWHILGATIGLIFLNLTFMLGVVLGIIGLLIGFYAMGIAFVFSPLLFLIDTIRLQTFEAFHLFASIALLGAGIILIYALIPVTKFFIRLFKKYIQWNIRVVKGGH